MITTKTISTMLNRDCSLCISSFGYENISKNAHWGKGRRDTYILHYVLEGEGFFNDHKVKSGSGFLILPKALHEYHSSACDPWKYFWVMFQGDAALNICEKYIKTDNNYIFDFDFKIDLLNLCENIFSETGVLSEAKSLSYFFTLLSYHEKAHAACGNYYVEEAKKFMNNHFSRDISITEVAASIGINDRYLYNLFIKNEKISPKKYLNALRLNSAKSMLANTDSPVSEIAVSNGFSDVLTFSRFFSKNLHISPTAYRKSIKNHVPDF